VHIVSGKPEKLKNILGEVVSSAGIGQFRCAETEKNPHVTFFFNNYRGEPFPGEDRACPARPKVPTYDMQPEMSAVEVTTAAKAAILSGKYGFIAVNYANPDMVGHTGSLPASIKAVEATDAGVGELLAALAQVGGKAVVCADHGNVEQMWDPVTNGPHTAHTLNLVEVFAVGEGLVAGQTKMRSGGRLADIAPTVLRFDGPAEARGDDRSEPDSGLIARRVCSKPKICSRPPSSAGLSFRLHAQHLPMKRTHHCAQLTPADLGASVALSGWVDSVRDHGGIIFIDLRDRKGITQVKFDPQDNADLGVQAGRLKPESVISIAGKVVPRPEGTVNASLPTGGVEVAANALEVLNVSDTPPFPLDDVGGDKVNEDLRLTYRYLDLRRPKMRKNLQVRHRAAKSIRD